MDKIFNSKLNNPFNNCLKDVSSFQGNRSIIDFILSTGQTYSQVRCFELCFDLDYIQNNQCDCKTKIGMVWFDCYTNLWTENRSDFKQVADCSYNFRSKFYSNNFTNVCKHCIPECDSASYSNTITTNFDLNNIEVNIFLDSLQFTSISMLPKMEVYDLISNIGGVLGLFMGLSFVNILEIADLFLEINTRN